MKHSQAQAFLRAVLAFILMVLTAVLVITIVSIARAQGAEVPGFAWDPPGWAKDVGLMAGAIVALVGFTRAKLWTTLDGIAVNAFGIALGVVMGAGLFFAQYFDTLLGGVSHGFQAGIAAWVLVEGTRRTLQTGAPMGLLGNGESVQDFIIGLAKHAVSAVQLPAALVAVAPLLTQFAQSETILTDELRSKLQGQVLHLLRKAGLAGVDL